MRFYFILISLLVCCGRCWSQTDSIYITKEIDVVRVVDKAFAPQIKSTIGSDYITIERIDGVPRIAGSVDILRYLQTLGGIQSNSEFQTGINIQGCDNQHTRLQLDGATVFSPSHLFGLFPGFVASQIKGADVVKGQHGASFGNRIGGSVSLQSRDQMYRNLEAEVNAGVLASEATVRTKLPRYNGMVCASARCAYIDQLYKSFLTFDGLNLAYHFNDLNLSVVPFNTVDNSLKFSFYHTYDKLSMFGDNLMLNTSIDWTNSAMSAIYRHGDFNFCLSYSGFQNTVGFDVESMGSVKTPSNIKQLSFNYRYDYDFSDRWSLSHGFEYTNYHTMPQYVIADVDASDFEIPSQVGNELSVWADARCSISSSLSFFAGARGIVYNSEETYLAVDPRFRIEFKPDAHPCEYSIHYGIYHQYLHQTGLTTGGLPCEFWLCADGDVKPQYAHAFAAKVSGNFKDKMYSLSSEIFFRQLHGTIECQQSVIDFITTSSMVVDDFLVGDGRNYGIELTASKNKGKITGHVGYSLGRSLRKYPELSSRYKYPSSHERIQDLSFSVGYKFSQKLVLNSVLTMSSGTAFTSPKTVYMMNGNIVSVYGDLNGSRLPIFHHMDLSANYLLWKKNVRELLLNLSIYNVYHHRNVLSLAVPSDGIYYRKVVILGIIPSISLTFKI